MTVLAALTEGADLETLFRKTKEALLENSILLHYPQIVRKLNSKAFEIGYSAVKAKDKLEPSDLTAILITQLQSETSIQAFREVIEILGKCPKQYDSFLHACI